MNKQQRTAICRDGQFQTRAADGELYVEGYFATFSGQYQMWENAVEQVDPHAFDDTLGGDIRALVNHDSTLVLGRTSAGTLTLRVDERGLWGSVRINQEDQDAMNLYNRVKRGDVTQCSFGFEILDQRIEEQPDGTTVFTLLRVKLWEVSVVTFPAYEDTGVEARRRDLADLQAKKATTWRDAMKKKLKGD